MVNCVFTNVDICHDGHQSLKRTMCDRGPMRLLPGPVPWRSETKST